MARLHGQAVAVLGHAAQGVDVADVEPGVHALAEHVPGQVDDVHVAGPLAVAEERALDPIRAGHQAELGAPRPCRGRCAGAARGRSSRGAGRCGGTTRWRRRRCWACTSRRRRQVQDDLALRRGLYHVHDGGADIGRVVELGAGEALGRILVSGSRCRAAGLLLKADAAASTAIWSRLPCPGETRRAAAGPRWSCRSGRSPASPPASTRTSARSARGGTASGPGW